MTEQEFIKEYKEQGFELYKRENVEPKLRLASEIIDMVKAMKEEEKSLIGQWGKFWDDDEEEKFIINELISTGESTNFPFESKNHGIFKNFQPLSKEAQEILNNEI